jgi:hypothetical protein
MKAKRHRKTLRRVDTVGKGKPSVFDFDDELVEMLIQAYRTANRAA